MTLATIVPRNLQLWVESAVLEVEEITSRMQSEQYRRLVQPAAETLQALTTITPERPVTTEEQPKPKAWGGKRDGCPEHPEAGTITRWTKACTVCGRVLDQGKRQDGGAAEGLTLQHGRSAATAAKI